MLKTTKKKLALNALALLSLTAVITSCRRTNDPGSGVGVEVENPDKTIKLDSEFVKEGDSSKYFGAYLVREGGDSPTYVSTKRSALLKSGEKVHLYAYDLPSGYTPGVTVLDENSNPTSELVVSDTGEVTAPTVTEEKTFTIALYGVPSKGTNIKQTVEVTVVPADQYVSDTYLDFTGAKDEERTEMAASIERYLYNQGLAPVTYMNNESSALYHSRLHSPFLDANNYIPGYGYGLYDYGSIDSPLSGEATEAYKYFYHEQIDASSEEGKFNYLNSNSNTVSTLYSYISQYYFSTLVNKDGNGYEYQAQLSRKDAPEAVNPDPNGASATWKVYLRVGADVDGENGETKGLTYRTASTIFKKFDRRKIKLEDYLTTFKLAATKSIGWYRGSEQAGESTLNRQIAGFAEFYNDSAEATSLPTDEEFSKKVGVKLNHEDNSIEITFNGKIQPDYAEYQLNTIFSNPISEEFVKELGGGDVIAGAKSYGASATVGTNKLTPLDTILSVGPYYLSTYESKKTIAYTKNEDWPIKKDNYGRTLYAIKGHHLNVNANLTKEGEELSQFNNNKNDTASIPDKVYDQYVNDSRRKEVGASSNFQYFLNTWDKAFWDENYAGGSTSWEVKPILSNPSFYKGLLVAIDRKSLADTFHKGTAFEIQEPVNKISPNSEVAYNETEAHKNVVNDVFGNAMDESQLANWKSNGGEFMQVAIKEELEAGHYTLGTGDNPTVVSFKLARLQGAEVANKRLAQVTQSWEETFAAAVSSFTDKDGKAAWMDNGKPRITLKVEFEDIPQTSDSQMQNDILYGGVKAGKFDGQTVYYVSGNGLDVVNNFEKYKSDDSSGFTLNFGSDTGIPTKDMSYEGKYYSFNALWGAANTTAFVGDNGEELAPVTTNYASVMPTLSNGKYTVTIDVSYLTEYISDLEFYLATPESYVPAGTSLGDDGKITLTFSGDTVIDGNLLDKKGTYAAYNYLEFVIQYKKTTNNEEAIKTYSGYWLVEKPQA